MQYTELKFHFIMKHHVELKFKEDYIKTFIGSVQRNKNKIGKAMHLDAAEISLSLPILGSIRYTAANNSRKIPSSAKLTPTSISKHLIIHQTKTEIH